MIKNISFEGTGKIDKRFLSNTGKRVIANGNKLRSNKNIQGINNQIPANIINPNYGIGDFNFKPLINFFKNLFGLK